MTELFDGLDALDPKQRELIELLLAREAGAQDSAPPAASPREAALAAIWREVLGVPEVGTHVSFFDIGGDSILSMQVVSRARLQGFTFGTQELFEHPTIAELAVIEGGKAASLPQQRLSGGFEATPIQRWFYSLQLANRNHWNMEALIQARSQLRLVSMRAALQALVDHHDILRLRCSPLDPEPRPFLVAEETVVLHEIELEEGDEPAALLMPLHTSLDLLQGPVLRVAALRSANGECRHLALVVHHLACDWVSLRILLEDLETAYSQAEAGLPVQLPAKTSSYLQYAQCLKMEIADPSALHAWRATLLQSETNQSPGTQADTHWHERDLSAELTQMLLRDSRRLLQADAHDLLLLAAALGLASIDHASSVLLHVEAHGRDLLAASAGDFSRTAGWFAQIVPVLIDVSDTQPALVERAVRAWSDAKHFALAYMQCCYGRGKSNAPPPARARFGFNYLGQFGAAREAAEFRLIPTPAGNRYARDGARPHDVEVIAYSLEGRLHMRWGYDSRRYDAAVIAAAAAETFAALENLLSVGGEKADPSTEAAYGLTATQEGMLYECVKSGDPSLYVEQIIWTFHGELSEEAFREAWRRVTERHSALRTQFEWRGREPVQTVLRRVSTDITAFTGDSEAYLRADLARGMALDHAPLLRIGYCKIDPLLTRVVLTGHHLILDAWATRTLMREWLQTYEHLAHGALVQLPPAVAFEAVVHWDAARDLSASEVFWLRALPRARPHAEKPSLGFSGEQYRCKKWQLAGELLKALHEQARRSRVTLATLAHAAWASAVRESGAGADVVLGTIVSGRERTLPGVDSIVGVLIHCVPFPIAIPGQGSVSEWLRRLQEDYRQVIEHQHVPLSRIRQLCGIPASQPLFESVVIFQNAGWTTRDLSGSLQVRDIETRGYSSYPLSIRFSPDADKLSIELLWSAAHHSEMHIAALSRRLSETLELFASRVDGDLRALPAHEAPAPLLKRIQPVPVTRQPQDSL